MFHSCSKNSCETF
uniref:Uncharacterized protein n=1 Tax=Anguilla anguilla TaxID=7936 RepID=A0A0E9V5Z2_ANGAN